MRTQISQSTTHITARNCIALHMSCAYDDQMQSGNNRTELLTEMYRQASVLKAVGKLFVWKLHVSLLHLPLIPQNKRAGLNVVICTALSI